MWVNAMYSMTTTRRALAEAEDFSTEDERGPRRATEARSGTESAETVDQPGCVGMHQRAASRVPMYLDGQPNNAFGQALRNKHRRYSVALRGPRSSSVLKLYEA